MSKPPFSDIPEFISSYEAGTPTVAPIGGNQVTTQTDDNRVPLDLSGSSLPDLSSANIQSIETDNRVRLKPMSGAMTSIFGPMEKNNILYPLFSTNGVLFPYSPTVQFSQDVDWKTTDITHSNYESASYNRTPAVNISISGKFTVQTSGEGRYLLAVIHFLRVVSKMYFGKVETTKTNGKPGLPPPVLLFSGYGDYMFNDLRVVVKNHSYTIDDTVNTVRFSTPDGIPVSLPAVLTLSLTLGVVQTPRAQREDFDIDKFRTGELMLSRKGWI